MIREATPADLPALHELWRAFGREVPDLPHRDDDLDDELREIDEAVRGDGICLLAEADGGPVGFALARKTGTRTGVLRDLYVSPKGRRGGLARELVREAATRLRALGAEVLEVDVLASNADARAVYERWAFAPIELRLAAPLERLERRLSAPPEGPTFGSVHVQTDDRGAVERAVHKFLPRFGRSAGTSVSEPRNGWVAVHDELCDREPKQLERLAQELSYALAAVTLSIGVDRGAVVRYTLYDRGGAVDEYASVPEFDGELPPGDVVALGSNPRVVARLTGADPARVREVARTAVSPVDLPPALDLVRAIAGLMGITEADRGWVPSR